MKATYLSPILLSIGLGLVACGGDDSGPTNVGPDANTTHIDAPNNPDIDAPQATPKLTGSLTNVTFQHVMIDAQTGDTTPVNDGCTTKIDSASFDVELSPAMNKLRSNDPAHIRLRLHDVHTSAGGANCTVSTAMFGNAGALANAQGVIDDSMTPDDTSDDVIALFAPLEAAEPSDLLDLELWNGFGGLSGGFAPGNYPISGDELAFNTCGVCVMLHTNVSQQNTMGDGDYFATGGSITLTAVGTGQ
ncbi:MAG TPA: hypothetical protein VHE35_03780 [Kofleriaceae bacterium]|nr:hypothetical protein [Kofleriaceae bacterium]